jgi:hypothetical protein
MIVKELFDKYDFEDVWNYFYENHLREDNDTKENLQNSKLAHKEAFLKIKSMDINKNPLENNILIVHKSYDEEYEYKEITLYYKDDIKSNFKVDEKIENDFDFSKMSLEELKKYRKDCYPSITTYAFEFSSWKEILRYIVNESSLKDFGELDFLCLVFYEMTFVGFNDEEVDTERENLENLVEEIKEEIKDNKEVSNFKPFKFPNEYKNLVTDNTRKQMLLDMVNSYKEIYPYFKEIYNN